MSVSFVAVPGSTGRTTIVPPLASGLLAVEGFLLLSERFRWFAFNENKGWTVLLAVASVALALLLLTSWFVVSRFFHWRFQFSIRSVLLLIVAVAVPCSWLGVEMKRAREQRETVIAVEKWSWDVVYDWQIDADFSPLPSPQPPGRNWLKDLLGDDFFTDAALVCIAWEPQFQDDWLENLKGLEQLRAVILLNVTDAELEHIEGLKQVQFLDVCSVRVTDAGLEHLKGLTQLQRLHLTDCHKVTDGGLRHVGGLTQLHVLDLNNTTTTDAGLAQLAGLTRLRSLQLCNTQVTDAGLRVVEGMTQLELLALRNADITDVGLEHIKSLVRLRELNLGDTQVTDAGLKSLYGLRELETLVLWQTKATDEGVRKLQQALPNCKISPTKSVNGVRNEWHCRRPKNPPIPANEPQHIVVTALLRHNY